MWRWHGCRQEGGGGRRQQRATGALPNPLYRNANALQGKASAYQKGFVYIVQKFPSFLEAARQLRKSPKTPKNILQNLFDKLTLHLVVGGGEGNEGQDRECLTTWACTTRSADAAIATSTISGSNAALARLPPPTTPPASSPPPPLVPPTSLQAEKKCLLLSCAKCCNKIYS